jgi:hypothetical protein
MMNVIYRGFIMCLVGAYHDVIADNLQVLVNPNFIQPLKPPQQSRALEQLHKAQKRIKKNQEKFAHQRKKHGHLAKREYFRQKKR